MSDAEYKRLRENAETAALYLYELDQEVQNRMNHPEENRNNYAYRMWLEDANERRRRYSKVIEDFNRIRPADQPRSFAEWRDSIGHRQLYF